MIATNDMSLTSTRSAPQRLSIVKPYVTEAGHTVTTLGRTNFLRRSNQSHSTPVVYNKGQPRVLKQLQTPGPAAYLSIVICILHGTNRWLGGILREANP